MSNNSDFAATMYESNPAVAALNKVPGFDPLKLMNRRRNPGAEKNEKDLDFKYKKLWFRLAYRKGRIRLNKLSITEQLAIFEAQVYLDLTDANPISNFTATCTKEEAGDKYIESAQIEAMDQALTNAGFGLQFVPAPIGGTENTVTQAAASPAENVQMPGTASKAVQAAAGTAGNAQGPVASPKAAQQNVQQRQQATVQQRTVAPQAAVQQKPVAAQQTAQQRTTTSQPSVQRPAAPQQRPLTQQAAIQQKPATAQPVVQQHVAPQAKVQQGQTAPQSASQQRPAPVQQQPVISQAPSGMQKTAVNPAASASPQTPAAVVTPAPQPAAELPASAEALPADQLPVTAEGQAQPITSDVAAAMSMLSGKKEPDTLPVAPGGTKAEEKAETMPEELPVAPDIATSAEPAATAPAANSPATSAGQEAKEDKPYTETTPVEEILQSMTLEDAKKVVVPSGTCRGWTLKEVAERRPPSLKFYLSEGYQGKDNILRAAARLVLEDFEKKAS